MNKKASLLIVLSLFIILVAFASYFYYKNYQASISKNVQLTVPTSLQGSLVNESAGQATINELEATNQQIQASSTLTEKLNQQKRQMISDLERANQEIQASSTLTEKLNQQKQQMISELEQTNQLITQKK